MTEDELKYLNESATLPELLPNLSENQLKYIVARQNFDKDVDAAESVGIPVGTVYNWPAYVRRACQLMALDGALTAAEILRRSVPKAATVKTAGLDSRSEKIQQLASTDILEFFISRAAQLVKQEQSGEVRIIIEHERTESQDT